MAQEAKELLKSLDTQTITDLFLREHPDQRGTKLNKNAMVSTLSKSSEEAGINALLTYLKRDELAALVAKAGITLKKEDNKHSKAVLIRRLEAAIADSNMHDFLTENGEEDVLKVICTDLDLDTESDKKADLVNAVSDAAKVFGLEAFFTYFDVDQLQDVAQDLKIKTRDTSNKRKLVEAIIFQKDIDRQPKVKKARVEASKKKKAIEKGITFEDIFQHYYTNEVRDYCKEHDIKTGGKKGDLIKRILAFLDGDLTVTKAGSEKKKKRGAKPKNPKPKTTTGTGRGRGRKPKKVVEEEDKDKAK